MKDPWLRIQLIGGLGNQLFQYATASAIAYKRDFRLLADNSFLPRMESPLTLLNLIEEDLSFINRVPKKFLGGELHRKYINRLANNMVYERDLFVFDENLESVKPNSTLRGFFQSWKYFKDRSLEIQNFIKAPFVGNLNISTAFPEIKGEATIAIHVRHGDYKKLSETFGILGRNYYKNSLGVALDLYPDAKILVFSDEVASAREHVPNAHRYIGRESGLTDFETLILMSRASVVIGANSSFSWWSAYLMEQQNPLRVFPKTWFRSFDADFSDLIPTNWLKIDSDFV